MSGVLYLFDNLKNILDKNKYNELKKNTGNIPTSRTDSAN